jgi:hypothetical protein
MARFPTEQEVSTVNEQMDLAATLMGQGKDQITAIIMAGDMLSQKRADALYEEGKGIQQASVMVGSYSRFEWVVTKYNEGHIGVEELSEWICELWRGSDPDDTYPPFLEVWQHCSNYKGTTLYDEKPLPDGEEFTIYRGQDDDSEWNIGLSWSLSKEVATRFANGAAMRSFQDGYLATAKVQRSHIIAYISGRNEEELIIDPICVKGIEWEFVPVPKRK